ncbi:MAG: hypothetical protein E7542_05825 [Ruminococcaceae bacterium]|nr:hypothetical protein [Oscillospiraceae bacterium]
MVLNKKRLKKVLITIIIALIIFSVISFAATKIIYDNIFTRSSCETINVTQNLQSMVNTRENVSYYSGENKLAGHLYRSTSSQNKNSLIVIACGIHSCKDSYLWQIKELTDYGWSVFVFDATGSCDSEGESKIGFPQMVYDLKATLNYIEKENRFGYNNLMLMGHSQGGYAVCCTLQYDYDISAVVSIAGLNSAMDATISGASQYVGPLAYGNYGFLWLYQTLLFDSQTVNLRADKVLSNTDTPALIIHGENDQVVPDDKFSIISHKDEINNKNVEYVVRSAPDSSGHTDILYDKDGTANNQLIELINNFFDKSITK